ncbi:MAG: hypothetical protein EOO77_16720 [Oxalobacteraceae bacterium]|nr:MAG: hypothetical protein EOO77_16720 [Oxalobacteraceae bacterium]
MIKVHDDPSEISPDEGEVHADGPSGAIGTMAVEAAAKTFNRLLYGAAKTQGQRTGWKAASRLA